MKQYEKEYHMKQMSQPYRSTEVFINWLEELHFLNHTEQQNVCDMACGGGANTVYLGNRFENIQFTGIDINREFIDWGNECIRQNSQFDNCRLYEGDWYHLDPAWKSKFDGIISFQTLSWLPEYKEPLRYLADLKPAWIAVSSLFYEGDMEYFIKVRDYYRSKECEGDFDYYYNIYSIMRVRQYLSELGYRNFRYIPFQIDIDLPKPDNLDLGTYTVKQEDGKRIQISGGMMMPWYFIAACR